MTQSPSQPTLTPAFAGRHEPKPLSFGPAELPGLSERLIRSHWENNYCGAVKALNAVERRLAALLEDTDLPPYVYWDLKREELLRTGSVRLHELYFVNWEEVSRRLVQASSPRQDDETLETTWHPG